MVGLSVEMTPLQPRPPDIAQAGAISGAILAALVGATPPSPQGGYRREERLLPDPSHSDALGRVEVVASPVDI